MPYDDDMAMTDIRNSSCLHYAIQSRILLCPADSNTRACGIACKLRAVQASMQRIWPLANTCLPACLHIWIIGSRASTQCACKRNPAKRVHHTACQWVAYRHLVLCKHAKRF